MSKEVTKDDVLAFLKSQFIMNIATVTKDGMPYSSTMLYAIDDDFTIYFVTHTDTKKVENLAYNPHISVAIWEHHKMKVQASGTVTVVENEEEKLATVDKLAEAATKDGSFWPPLFRLGGKDYIVYKISLTSLEALDLVSDSITEVAPPITKITF